MSSQIQSVASMESPGWESDSIRDLISGDIVAARVSDAIQGADPFSQFIDLDLVTGDFSATELAGGALVVVVGERHVTSAPTWILETVQRLREAGHRIALAGVGTSYPSLAILPLLRPDIIEVDVTTINQQPDWQSAQTLNAVTTYAEELPALVLATGIGTSSDLLLALGFGATLGQGPFLDAQASTPSKTAMAGISFDTDQSAIPECGTPFTVASARPTRTGSRAQLARTSHFLETCAFDCDEATVVVSTFQRSSNLTDEVVELYSALSRNLSYVFALSHPASGPGLSPEDIPHLRVRAFEPDHPLSKEWNVIIINARYQAMLAARETADSTDDDTRYEYVLTHDRNTIIRAVQTLTPLL